MKTALILAGSLLLAGIQESSAAYSVELNGIVCLFSQKTAFFVLGRGENAGPTSFSLSEGESEFGIKLLAVDDAGQRVQIERHGKKEYLRLCGAPNQTVVAAGKPVSETPKRAAPDEKSVAGYLASEEVQRIKSGNPVWIGGGRSNGQKADVANNGSNSSSGNSPASSPVLGQADPTKELWYQDCLIIEQQRAATVADVVAGRKTPWPRTPLTPPGTPGSLVGRDTVYGNLIPGARLYGFVD